MTIKTRNEEWGFYGTMLRNAGEAASPTATQAIWNEAMAALRAKDMTEEMARDFLDSRYGRHLADAVGTPAGDVRAALKGFERWIAFFKKHHRAGDFGEV